MGSTSSASGTDLLEMLAAGTQRLQHYAFDIDALNVFPVPDGDTGSNMLFSMRAALEEARNAPKKSASGVAEAFARGALVGARGNSGIILSQFWQGLAQAVDGKRFITATDLATSMQKAAVLAYQALSKPVEGTILTVINDIAAATRSESVGTDDLVSFMERVVDTARESVTGTPRKLSVLQEAGVVDAGGWGLQIILEGALDYLRSDREDSQQQHPSLSVGTRIRNQMSKTAPKEGSYGCCTEFLLRGNDLDPDSIRAFLGERGESLVVAGNEKMVRVHLHTEEPDAVVLYARSLGQVDRLNIRDMNEQHEAFLRGRKGGTPETSMQDAAAVLALVPSDGLAAVFRSLGARPVVVNEQDLNRGIAELRKAIEEFHDPQVLVLPGSRVLLSEVEQLCGSLLNRVVVVPAKTIPQSISAVLAFTPGEDFATNRRLMTDAIGKVYSMEIGKSTDYPDSGGIPSTEARLVGLLEGELSAGGDDVWTVLRKLIAKLDTDDAELVTIYHSDGVSGEAIEGICSNLRRSYPCLEVETVPAGSLRPDFIVSIE